MLLDFGGRLARGRLLAGVFAVASLALVAGHVLRLQTGAACDMIGRSGLLPAVYLGALAFVGALFAYMTTALFWKRAADMGWPRVVALLPVCALAGAAFAYGSPVFGPCGVATPERLGAVAAAGGGFLLALALHLFPGRAGTAITGGTDRPTDPSEPGSAGAVLTHHDAHPQRAP